MSETQVGGKGKIEEVPDEQPKEQTTDTAGQATQDVELPGEFELTPETALPITSASLTRLLVVAGQQSTGKTTLVASIYERFLRQQKFAGYCFAGSETLRGFELRSHLARMASGLMHSETERTRRSEKTPLLHFRVRREDLAEPARDLLFTDISGEVFREAKDSTEACKRLEVLRRADRILLLIDGSKLSSEEQRFPEFSAGRDFLRRATAAQMLGGRSLVDVLFTKWDLVVKLGAGERRRTEEYVGRLEGWLREDFQAGFAGLQFAQVAARPDAPSELRSAHGLEALFPKWVEESSLPSSRRGELEAPRLEREFDRYLVRRGRNALGWI